MSGNTAEIRVGVRKRSTKGDLVAAETMERAKRRYAASLVNKPGNDEDTSHTPVQRVIRRNKEGRFVRPPEPRSIYRNSEGKFTKEPKAIQLYSSDKSPNWQFGKRDSDSKMFKAEEHLATAMMKFSDVWQKEPYNIPLNNAPPNWRPGAPGGSYYPGGSNTRMLGSGTPQASPPVSFRSQVGKFAGNYAQGWVDNGFEPFSHGPTQGPYKVGQYSSTEPGGMKMLKRVNNIISNPIEFGFDTFGVNQGFDAGMDRFRSWGGGDQKFTGMNMATARQNELQVTRSKAGVKMGGVGWWDTAKNSLSGGIFGAQGNNTAGDGWDEAANIRNFQNSGLAKGIHNDEAGRQHVIEQTRGLGLLGNAILSPGGVGGVAGAAAKHHALGHAVRRSGDAGKRMSRILEKFEAFMGESAHWGQGRAIMDYGEQTGPISRTLPHNGWNKDYNNTSIIG